MFKEMYREEMSQVKLNTEQKERLAGLMAAVPARKARRAGRTALVLAAVIALCACSAAAAYVMGALDFLKEQNGYAYLGQTEVYETYAVPVERSVTAENGDVLTVERVATDGKFCTVFYAVRFQEAAASAQELAQIQKNGVPNLVQLWQKFSLFCTLSADGEEISLEGYSNTFETQEYLADEHTLYGAWHVLLRRPLEEGEQVTLQAAAWNAGDDGVGRTMWEVSMDFDVHPAAREHFEPGVTFQAPLAGSTIQAEVLSFDRSPLGTLLTVRYDWPDSVLNVDFVLRDAGTGAYIPFAEVSTSHSWDPEGCYEGVYELFGDVSALENLELIPTRTTSSISPQKAVRLEDLPCVDSGNPAGGYAPASYTVEDGQLIVAMKPVGAANGAYALLANGVGFLDENGESLFSAVSTRKFKNRTDGTITVVTTPSPEAFQEDIGKVARIWFFVQQYELLQNMAVMIPLTDDTFS